MLSRRSRLEARVAVTSMSTTVVVEASGSGPFEGLAAIASWMEHKSLESPQPYSLDIPQRNILVLGQHKNLVVTRYGDPFRKTGRIP